MVTCNNNNNNDYLQHFLRAYVFKSSGIFFEKIFPISLAIVDIVETFDYLCSLECCFDNFKQL